MTLLELQRVINSGFCILQIWMAKAFQCLVMTNGIQENFLLFSLATELSNPL